MSYTDATIPIACSECEAVIEGVGKMMEHILDSHPNYSAVDAVNYARDWADNAYTRADIEMTDYYDQARLDRQIHGRNF